MKTRNLYIVTMLFCAAIFIRQQASASCDVDGNCRPPLEPEREWELSHNERNLRDIISYEICLRPLIVVYGEESTVACGSEIRRELEYYINSHGVETRLNASNENCRVVDSSLKCYNDDITIVNNEIQIYADVTRDIYRHFPCSRRGGNCAIIVKYGTAIQHMIRHRYTPLRDQWWQIE